MIKRSVLCAGLLCASVATAAAEPEDILSPEEFRAFTAGTTLYFAKRGQPYGAEHYFEDGRVIWSFVDGPCERGAWFEHDGQVCFAYETQSSAQCWHFFTDGDAHHGRVVGGDPEEDLTVVGQDSRLLDCPAPGVGVSYTVPLRTY